MKKISKQIMRGDDLRGKVNSGFGWESARNCVKEPPKWEENKVGFSQFNKNVLRNAFLQVALRKRRFIIQNTEIFLSAFFLFVRQK